MADRSGEAIWEGDLFEGSGAVSAVTTGLFTDAGVTWAARTESPEGKTSPEELLASAHAACFSMALANEMSTLGVAPTRLEVQATATFEPPKITKMALQVSAAAPGLDEAKLGQAIAAAEESCPVSNALRGNIEIDVDAHLA